MNHSRRFGRVASVLTTAVVAAALAAPATAKPLEHGKFHEEFSDIVEDFCGVPGLTVRFDGVAEGSFKANRRGRDGLVYFMEHVHVSDTGTNLDNGQWIRDEVRTLSKDLHVTDNGDGTLTILSLSTGNVVIYGADGEVLARNPGQVRFEVDVDHAGTPGDPSDDVFLAFRLVKESTGRTDDECAAAVGALT